MGWQAGNTGQMPLVRFVPISLTAVTITAAIIATIRPYSTAVAPGRPGTATGSSDPWTYMAHLSICGLPLDPARPRNYLQLA